MSKSTTETATAFPARSTSLTQPRASPLSIHTSPRQDRGPAPRANAHSPRAASASHLRDIIGLGITSDHRIDGSKTEFTSSSPATASGFQTRKLSDDLGDLGIRLNAAQGLVVKLRADAEPVDAAFEALHTDGQDSVASSIRKYRSSTDSITTVSTLPTTPGPRMSFTSDFSRSLSFKSPLASAPSTPAHSRSPSPPRLSTSTGLGEQEQHATSESNGVQRKRSFVSRKTSSKHKKNASEDFHSSDDQADRKSRGRSGLLRRKSHQSASNGLDKSFISDNEAPKSAKSDAPAVPPLPKSFSTDKLPSLRSPTTAASSGRSTPVPRLRATDRPSSRDLVLPKKKDELWSIFRSLDADFAKFASKSIAFKASVVRSSLLPFLRAYAMHPSNRALRPEDLDRRANILNKWWTGLIELLHGRNNQSISGTDRPAILDGISGIMDRAEWRLSPSQFCPLDQRLKGTVSPPSRSKSSLASSSSDFLADSVHHNVRNIFVQNLSAQMAFVVDKMSLRHASASLVTFCGKACAYAFMFVPSMADVLARLWDLRIDTFKRVLEGYEIGRFDDVSHLAEAIVSGFPPTLHHLALQSLTKYMRKLRTPPQLPAGTANIEWWGHWLERWSGRESDLFYVFVKHFHILVTDYLPPHATKQERICAPGMLLVQAQILVNLDATIHRSSSNGHQDPIAAAGLTTTDDVLADPDAIVSAFSLPPPTNATRLMAENRLIMLIRDILNERTADYPAARLLFAETFNDLLQICTTGISLFDHAACYTLLDFVEEALVMLVRFERSREGKGSFLNLDFWILAWKKMIQSHNTMTEIRLYSFLYTVWNTIICESGWKAELCFDMLLDTKIFARTFNHWCPMVRAYFMRLLCWRVARHDGDYSSMDVDIFETLAERLGNTWSNYLFLRGLAELEGCAPPLTNPCYPVPGRRLLIIRTDPVASPVSALLSFDGMRSPKFPLKSDSDARKRASTVSQLEVQVRPGSAWSDIDTEGEQRGRSSIGGFLRNIIPNKARSKSQRAPSRAESRLDSSPPPNMPNGGIVRSATDDLTNQRASALLDTGLPTMSRSPTSRSPTSSTTSSPTSAGPEMPTHRKFCFKFSLELHPHAARPLPPMRLQPPRLPLPAQQFLMMYSQKANSGPGTHACAVQPRGESKAHATYCGRALAEWTLVVGECHSFFDRRRAEGVGERRWVETPMLGVEVFRRPG